MYIQSSNIVKINIEDEIKKQLQYKLSKLNTMEELIFSQEKSNYENKQNNNNNNQKSLKSSLLQRLTSKLLNNLQLEIHNIHIQYVDQDQILSYRTIAPSIHSLPDSAILFGFGLESFIIHTCNEQGQATTASINDPITYKKIELKNWFVYVQRKGEFDKDYQPQSTDNDKNNDKYMNTICIERNYEIISASQILSHSNIQYIVSPMNALIDITFNKYESPSTSIQFHLPSIELSLTQSQYYCLFIIFQNLSSTQSYLHSLLATIPSQQRNATKQERKVYIQLYKRSLNSYWLESLTEDEKKEKVKLEEMIVNHEINLFRRTAINIISQQLPTDKYVQRREEKDNNKNNEKKPSGGLFSSIFGGNNNSDTKPIREFSENEEESVYQFLYENPQYESIQPSTNPLPSSFIHTQFTFILSSWNATLYLDKSTKIFNCTAEQLQLLYISRPKSSSLYLSLQSITGTDFYSKNTLFEQIIYSPQIDEDEFMLLQNIDENESNNYDEEENNQFPSIQLANSNLSKSNHSSSSSFVPIIRFQYHVNPLTNTDIDMKVNLQMLVPQIVINAQVIQCPSQYSSDSFYIHYVFFTFLF